MKLRTLIALLLALTLYLTALGSPRTETDSSSAADDESERKITPDEEREARELAALFIKRWDETEDINPLIKEFFVHDFAERLHYEPRFLFFGDFKGEQLRPENSADLQRHYAAMIDFLRLMFRLGDIYASLLSSEEGQEEMNLRRILPAGILEVFRSNRALNALMSEELGEEVEGQTEGSEQSEDSGNDARAIKNIEELRSLTMTLEQANTLLRAHLKTLPNTLSVNASNGNRPDDTQSSASAETDDPLMPRIYTLDEDLYGYPKGTRLICLSLAPFHIDLVRDGERLKVLSLGLQTD